MKHLSLKERILERGLNLYGHYYNQVLLNQEIIMGMLDQRESRENILDAIIVSIKSETNFPDDPRVGDLWEGFEFDGEDWQMRLK